MPDAATSAENRRLCLSKLLPSDPQERVVPRTAPASPTERPDVVPAIAAVQGRAAQNRAPRPFPGRWRLRNLDGATREFAWLPPVSWNLWEGVRSFGRVLHNQLLQLRETAGDARLNRTEGNGKDFGNLFVRTVL